MSPIHHKSAPPRIIITAHKSFDPVNEPKITGTTLIMVFPCIICGPTDAPCDLRPISEHPNDAEPLDKPTGKFGPTTIVVLDT